MKSSKLLVIILLWSAWGMAQEPPKRMLWAWESPQNLEFLMKNDPQAGVAFLSRTVLVNGNGVFLRPRMQPLRVSPRTYLVAVVRIESKNASLSGEQVMRTAEAAAEAVRQPGVRELQIDYDAKLSEREFYGGVLRELRRRLPRMRITMTALASWCMNDDWIRGLPVDAAVPMLFRLGAERDLVRRMWATSDKDPLCREKVGLSTDEVRIRTGSKQVWWFHPGPWDKESVARVAKEKP